MGHATRSQVVIDELLRRHDVRVVASGAAFRYLENRLPRVKEVFGPSFAMEEGEIRRWATVRQNFRRAPAQLPEAVKLWLGAVDEWHPEVVITDFEPLAGIYARATRTPLVCVDNINMLVRCRHDREIIGEQRNDYLLARAVTRAMVPSAGDYIITTFFTCSSTRAASKRCSRRCARRACPAACTGCAADRRGERWTATSSFGHARTRASWTTFAARAAWWPGAASRC